MVELKELEGKRLLVKVVKGKSDMPSIEVDGYSLVIIKDKSRRNNRIVLSFYVPEEIANAVFELSRKEKLPLSWLIRDILFSPAEPVPIPIKRGSNVKLSASIPREDYEKLREKAGKSLSSYARGKLYRWWLEQKENT